MLLKGSQCAPDPYTLRHTTQCLKDPEEILFESYHSVQASNKYISYFTLRLQIFSPIVITFTFAHGDSTKLYFDCLFTIIQLFDLVLILYFMYSIWFSLMYFLRKTGGNPDDDLIKIKMNRKLFIIYLGGEFRGGGRG